jgi:hypothetical protein
MKQELAPRGVGIPVLQGREDVKVGGYLNALEKGK